MTVRRSSMPTSSASSRAGANFLLNCPPNRDGLLDAEIVTRLADVGEAWAPDTTRVPLPRATAADRRRLRSGRAPPRPAARRPTPSTARTTGTPTPSGSRRARSRNRSPSISASSAPTSSVLELRPALRRPGRARAPTARSRSYSIETSTDGTTFTPVTTGRLARGRHDEGRRVRSRRGPLRPPRRASPSTATNAAATEIAIGARASARGLLLRAEPVGADRRGRASRRSRHGSGFLSWSAIWPMRCLETPKRVAKLAERHRVVGGQVLEPDCPLARRRSACRGSRPRTSARPRCSSASRRLRLGRALAARDPLRQREALLAARSRWGAGRTGSRATRGAGEPRPAPSRRRRAWRPAAWASPRCPPPAASAAPSRAGSNSLRPARVLPTWMRREFVIRKRST